MYPIQWDMLATSILVYVYIHRVHCMEHVFFFVQAGGAEFRWPIKPRMLYVTMGPWDLEKIHIFLQGNQQSSHHNNGFVIP